MNNANNEHANNKSASNKGTCSERANNNGTCSERANNNGVAAAFNEVDFTKRDLASFVPRPARNANKYSRGVLCAICGAAAYPGAAVLAAKAAQRAGAGYTQVWCAPESLAVVQASAPSVVACAWDASALDIALDAAESEHSHPSAVLIGCGFAGNDSASTTYDTAATATNEVDLLRAALASTHSVLVDGGALSCLAHLVTAHGCNFLAERAAQGAHLVLTPHAGEAHRLLKALLLNKDRSSSKQGDIHAAYPNVVPAACAHSSAHGEEIAAQANLAHFLAENYAATVVLKGPQTIVANHRSYYVMDAGTPALAKAGTGDVLAGIIAAFLAQGVDAFYSGVAGSYVHAQAGQRAEQHKGCVSVIPEDVIECIPTAIQALLI